MGIARRGVLKELECDSTVIYSNRKSAPLVTGGNNHGRGCGLKQCKARDRKVSACLNTVLIWSTITTVTSNTTSGLRQLSNESSRPTDTSQRSTSVSRRRTFRRRPNSRLNYYSMLASVAGGVNWSAYVDNSQSSQPSSLRHDTVDGLTHMDRMNDISDSPGIGDLSGIMDHPTRLAERIDNNDPTQLVESFVCDPRAAGNVAIGEEPTFTQALVGVSLFILVIRC
ncbi:hypothetical protein LSAT2_026204 [Lamellibrachia satsuma]|nr:hypothetical protein LSAT2_026204 [Lamellibrachia satsuma]